MNFVEVHSIINEYFDDRDCNMGPGRRRDLAWLLSDDKPIAIVKRYPSEVLDERKLRLSGTLSNGADEA